MGIISVNFAPCYDFISAGKIITNGRPPRGVSDSLVYYSNAQPRSVSLGTSFSVALNFPIAAQRQNDNNNKVPSAMYHL